MSFKGSTLSARWRTIRRDKSKRGEVVRRECNNLGKK